MTDEQRKEYLKKKEKKIHKNQQVDRNNMLYEARNNRKERTGWHFFVERKQFYQKTDFNFVKFEYC